MTKSLLDTFLETYEGLELPEELSRRFDVLECLSSNETGETYKLSEKDGGKKYVIKCRKKKDIISRTHEAELLRGLEHKGLPVYEPETEHGDTLFIMCEYIYGVTLDKYLCENQSDTAWILNIVKELCDILSYLHSQPAPIIHRDIKPSNIIIKPEDSSVTLIDFGISRKYSKGAKNDTTYYGTEKYSAPEQYGFSQTDSRSIYFL